MCQWRAKGGAYFSAKSLKGKVMQEDAKQKQEAEQCEGEEVRVVGQGRRGAGVCDAGGGANQVQGVVGGVEALEVAWEAAYGAEQALGGEVQRDVGGEADGGGEGEIDGKAEEGEGCAGADGSSWGE